jgi:hypothetical protein
MEEEKEVKTVKIDYRCDKCNVGFMRQTGTVFPTSPPQVPHKCNNVACDNSMTFSVIYPYLEYKEK